MTESTPSITNRFSFTKIITKDLEGLASFYKKVFGMRELQRVSSRVNDEPIEEIILSISGDMANGPVLVLFDFTERPPAQGSDVILGFVVPDLSEVLTRVLNCGGAVMAEPKTHDEGGVSVPVAFMKDPEGRLLEIVEMAM